ncbi:MAG: hypothetical protein COY66_04170 [Candidatus Kerfeldbacteria bacterium CG_4_10_14_0_8_um_filter_42_10]|uniref:Sugar 3,4-ketoisomerase QdtA cupin domain-containing protein n=1 Tax=Candidatus Kerfeldbacteria bacterium CG_4_10_14_0_8_um_filter_42_10 TaxID=2014248 RepID=A0A2M7RI05_9BACT|nr:MAG: hypothetical protein COY66_04170 [Candidatus Kerfeldbacteria bacterium CG_4_10_14_0_8_um_filter_42_10]
MNNSMDQYSSPLKIEETKLGIKYWLNPRRTKPGRELLVIYDQRLPFMKFKLRYSYYVRFLEEGVAAGNHYHKKKEEIFIPLAGEFEVHLENIVSKEREIIKLNAFENVAFYVRTNVSHKVTSNKKEGVLLIMASQPNNDEDDIDHQLD